MKKIVIAFLLISVLVAGRSVSALAQSRISPEFLWTLGRPQVEAISADKQTLLYSVKRTDMTNDQDYIRYYLMNTHGEGSGEALELPAHVSALQFHPGGSALLLLQNDTLCTYSLASKRIQKLLSFPVEGYWISADGGTLFYTRQVQYGKLLTDLYPDMKKSDAAIFTDLDYRHLKQWRGAYRNNLFLARLMHDQPVSTGQNIMYGESFDASQVACTADGHFVAYESKKVPPNEQTTSTNSDIYLYNTQTGKTENVSQANPGYDQFPVFSPNGQKLAWTSMQTPGYETDRNRIMLLDLATRQLKELTGGFDANANNPLWLDDNTLIFSSEQRGTVQLFQVDLSGKIQAVTQGAHTVDRFLPAGTSVLYTRSAFDRPTEIYQTDLASGTTTQRTFVNTEALKTVKLGSFTERFTTTFDHKTLQSWVVFPPDFDPEKQYPVVLYCQGGPQSGLTSAWGLRWSMQMIAAQGYIVIAPNRRGTFGFGTAWTQGVSQHWGDAPMKDLLAAVDDLAKEPYVDKNRMAAVGGSFGGYSVYYLAGHHEKRFKCFIAHAGLFNLESFYLTTDELFFANWDMGGSFWENPKHRTYRKYSPHRFVRKWDTPIMVIQGGIDFRVPESEAFQAFRAAQLRGIPSKMLYFPGEGHALVRPQNSLVWQREFMQWLGTYLS